MIFFQGRLPSNRLGRPLRQGLVAGAAAGRCGGVLPSHVRIAAQAGGEATAGHTGNSGEVKFRMGSKMQFLKLEFPADSQLRRRGPGAHQAAQGSGMKFTPAKKMEAAY